eukprot:SAG11_NODE_4230_length_1998_cov_1.804107_1_plen_140_part_10
MRYHARTQLHIPSMLKLAVCIPQIGGGEDTPGDIEDHLHEITVILSWLHTQKQDDGSTYVAFAFDVKVFGVIVYKFYNRFSLLQKVHREMEEAGCLATMQVAFPKQTYIADYNSDTVLRNQRGCAKPPSRICDGSVHCA